MEAPGDLIRRLVAEEIDIVEYDPAWPGRFEDEARFLRSCVPAGLIGRIEHFGSTAVPGLAAKPVIDVLVEAFDLSEVRARVVPILVAKGYEYLWRPTYGDDGPPFYAWFIKRDGRTGARSAHIHMVEPDMTSHWDRLHFRDYLRRFPDVASEYADLKRRLVRAFPRDRVAYTQEKSAFIREVTRKAKAYFGEP